ncbi:hypothetical protein [Streptomyces sp. WMMC940]|uniref:hypothetical protein n=1 Tax=Streptomyces sp. WMMC940 TaxID=3015153 RepID=UPI0022B6DA61|nr:hypothetical protein [Streptomyces sp. WMMC940]MCZ7457652.1 hypothetical protein [Streptomyces sp. WMMC940]
MADEKQPKSGNTPPLTKQEQEQAQEQAQIEGQFAATDMVERMQDFFGAFGFGAGGSVFGSTVFDGRKLNEMLDFLESTNPADLEHAGEALEKANVAINKAAKELDDFVKRTDWRGEGATEFQRYGKEVVGYAWSVGKMANAVGAQMKVASTGLTSVRNARPPRDNRSIQKDVKDFKLPEQTADNPEYQKALQVEKDRQEAINQMNRLASFYAVSQSTLAEQEMPKPPATYKAAVPRPKGEWSPGGSSESPGPRGDFSRPNVGQAGTVGEAGVAEVVPRSEALGMAGTATGSTSMEIDSVATVPPPTTAGPTTAPPTATSGPNQGSGPVPAPFTGPGLSGRAGQAPRTGDPRTSGGQPNKAIGRAGTAGGSPPLGRSTTSTGRPGFPNATSSTTAGRSPVVGRPSAMGMPGGGTTGRPGAGVGRGQAPVVGSPGGTGQPAAGRVTGTNGPRSSGASGIVGGTPQRSTSGSTGSRIPRGTVIGGESAAAGRSTAARPDQSGVVGANSGNKPTGPVGRGTPSANGVVGTPRSPGSPGSGSGSVGNGLLGSRADRRRPGDEQDREGSARPDYLTEDEETWANRRRGAVPPVID